MSTYFHTLNQRRKELRLTFAILAKRSGVSMPTVVRILSSKYPQASFGNVAAIAEALGMAVEFRPTASSEEIREQQARKKARELVGLVQGTSGLEAQAVDSEHLDTMTRKTVHDLLAGPSRRLWGS